MIDSLKTLLETGEPMPAVDTGDRAGDGIDVEGKWHRMQASPPTTAHGSCSTVAR